jgi:hypothetical protein
MLDHEPGQGAGPTLGRVRAGQWSTAVPLQLPNDVTPRDLALLITLPKLALILQRVRQPGMD